MGTSLPSGGECSFIKVIPYAIDYTQTENKGSRFSLLLHMCLNWHERKQWQCSPCCKADCTQSSRSPTSPAPWPSPAGWVRRSALGLCLCRYGFLWVTWRTTWPTEPTTDRKKDTLTPTALKWHILQNQFYTSGVPKGLVHFRIFYWKIFFSSQTVSILSPIQYPTLSALHTVHVKQYIHSKSQLLDCSYCRKI